MSLAAVMVTVDCAEPQELARWWAGALGGEIVEDHGEFVMVAAQPVAMGFQRVAEERRGKNRVHVDFRVATGTGMAGEVERLVALGASVVGEHSVPGLTWTVLQDPAGNEFCVH
ncbi:VOC family protein [Kitasatospora sp. NA04385]|uniref:VOC family protein n=1 Tax=Kitasatospora sp. NA04385 TaxID=2742135 RepID=UPI001592880A|nr:VOC family protein [Kitasatospora sp. NA04385]QKW18027.1 VOC family protein [Kitasatospora sp. NA04385]